MTVTTYEGVVQKGKIRLKTAVRLPENTTVYVIVPGLKIDEKKVIRMLSPRLANRKQAIDFKMLVTEIKPHAKVRR